MNSVKDLKINVGLEFEFYGYKIQDYIENFKYSYKKEWYYSQIEYNNFLKRDIKLGYFLSDRFFKWVKWYYLILGNDLNICSGKKIYVTPYPIVNSGAIAFNGVHLHFSLSDSKMNSAFLNYVSSYMNRLEEELFYLVRKYDLLTYRKLCSHHILGKYRSSAFDYKKRNRFTPININYNLNTIEIRIFDGWDLIYYNILVKILKKFFYKLIKTFLKEKIYMKNEEAYYFFDYLISVNSEKVYYGLAEKYYRSCIDIKKFGWSTDDSFFIEFRVKYVKDRNLYTGYKRVTWYY